MPYITISPVPTAGNTLIGQTSRGVCRLTDNKFFYLYGQTGTNNYTYGTVFSVDNIRAASPVATIIRTQTIPALGSPTSFKCARLNDTDVLVLKTISSTLWDIYVLRIDPSTNEITKVGNTQTETNPTDGNQSSALSSSTSSGGGIIQALADNIVAYTVYRGSSSINYVRRVIWDPQTLVLAAPTTLANISWAGTYYRAMSFAKARDGVNWQCVLSTGVNNITAHALWTQHTRVYGSPTGGWTTATPNGYAGSFVSLPVSGNQSLELNGERHWMTMTGSTPALTATGFALSGKPNFHNTTLGGTWLNQDYFMYLMTASTVNSSTVPASNDGFHIRVVKYTDTGYGEVSAPTATPILRFNNMFVQNPTSCFEYLAPDVLLCYGSAGTASTSALTIGILNTAL